MEFKVNLATMTAVREAVPAELRGLLPDTLRNLQQALDPVPEHLVGIEYWPGLDVTKAYNAETHALGDETLTCDAESKTVLVERAHVPIPAEQVAAALAATKAAHIQKIESTVVAIFAKPVTLRSVYEQREADAVAYRDAGYTGEAGELLAKFAQYAGIDLTVATDRVLSQAEAFRAAEPKLENLRMRKYEVERATTKAQADAIFADVMTKIAEVVATIG